MKIYTVNLKKYYTKGKGIIKFAAILILIVFVAKLSANIYPKSEEYMQTISELSEKGTIIIDAGHGGEDCGAIGVSGIYEKDLNLSIANEIGQMLSEKGFAVIYTRTNDALLYTEEENIHGIRKISDLKNRCKYGAEYPNALYISLHMNSYKSSKCSGLQVYYSENNEASYSLASSIQNNVKSKLQYENNRQIKAGKNMFILENLSNPAVLIECGFLSNPIECENLSKKEYQKELSFAIICGIIEYIDK